MLTVSVTQLLDALDTAPTYECPEMNAGAKYIHNILFDCHITERAIKLSEINFKAFDLGDIDDFLNFNSDMGRHAYQTEQVAQLINALKPTVVSGTFV